MIPQRIQRSSIVFASKLKLIFAVFWHQQSSCCFVEHDSRQKPDPTRVNFKVFQLQRGSDWSSRGSTTFLLPTLHLDQHRKGNLLWCLLVSLVANLIDSDVEPLDVHERVLLSVLSTLERVQQALQLVLVVLFPLESLFFRHLRIMIKKASSLN